jgi:exonuclease SbcC
MIPVRLKLFNFLPYRGDIQPFSFDGIHLACISGANGAGKTSIIDAMTWALWGKSRAGSKSTGDDDLISQGEREMAVTFDFRTGDGRIYRVERRRSLPKKGKGAGQGSLKVFTMEDDQVTADISGSTKEETSEIIRRLVGLDYETFINSAYLKQGEADHFTGLTPAKRKEVLGSILNLETFDQLSESAKVKANQAQASIQLISESIGFERQRLAEEPELRHSLGKVETELETAKAEQMKRQSELQSLRQQRQSLEAQRQTVERMEKAVMEIMEDLAVRKRELKDTEERLLLHKDILANKADIEAGFNDLSETRKCNDELNRQLAETRELEREASKIKSVIEAERQKLEAQRARWQAGFEQIQEKAAEMDELNLRKKTLGPEIEALRSQEKQRDDVNERIQQERLNQTRCDSEIAGLKNRQAEIAERIRLLDTGDAVCPVCTSELTSDKKYSVMETYHREAKECAQSIAGKTTEKTASAERLALLQSALEKLSGLEAEKRKLSQQEAAIDAQLEEARKCSDRLPEGQKKLAEISRVISEKSFAEEEHRRLAEVEARIEKLGYDPQAHERTQAKLRGLEHFELKQQELARATERFALEQEASTRIRRTIALLTERLTTRRQEAEEAKKMLCDLPDVTDEQMATAEAATASLAEQVSSLNETIGSLKQSLVQLERLKQDITTKEAEVRKFSESEGVYRELQKHFGRNGLQANLIEDAVPEIEAEANALLSRMTDNRMSLKLELQRLTRKGETTETFDIKVSDELGIRDYELFSGGEAFRINFALRLALSRLLSHRTGAPLRTLIIDEGFGTQDAAGIDKLKAAISSIQDQFDCVLVITHIEEFKDAFPARIEVFKTPDGSDIRVAYN